MCSFPSDLHVKDTTERKCLGSFFENPLLPDLRPRSLLTQSPGGHIDPLIVFLRAADRRQAVGIKQQKSVEEQNEEGRKSITEQTKRGHRVPEQQQTDS